ncbi:hypothetical protein EVAR_29446_1 [Eumeta japonica]|uniref:Uncharacterized protein n=1 Tax=Eumeta variegata TaxID=151549 RepID=A0A4C1VTQ1_EUMVA|nr:hypothetical protein EVAR_29446_1 [Eumeta japonica]
MTSSPFSSFGLFPSRTGQPSGRPATSGTARCNELFRFLTGTRVDSVMLIALRATFSPACVVNLQLFFECNGLVSYEVYFFLPARFTTIHLVFVCSYKRDHRRAPPVGCAPHCRRLPLPARFHCVVIAPGRVVMYFRRSKHLVMGALHPVSKFINSLSDPNALRGV